MVGITICDLKAAGQFDASLIATPRKHQVELVQMLRPGVSPGNLVMGLRVEEGIDDTEIITTAELQKALPILIHFPKSKLAQAARPRAVIRTNLYIKVSQEEDWLLLSSCQVSTADVVLIHLRSVASREKVLVDLGPRDPSQPWVMFEPETHLQSNVLFHTNYELLDGFFNRTMHHRRDSDILVLHGFIVGRGRDASFLPPSWRQDPVLFPNKTRRKLAVAFVSNCKDNSGRLQYIRTLKKYARVDVYGRCGDHKCGSSRYAEHAYKPATDPCMRMAGDSYLFYLAFENALCTDYVTEKLYKLLYYPLIPVVLGAANYSALMPPGSYINALHYTPQQLAYKMKYLADHPQIYVRVHQYNGTAVMVNQTQEIGLAQRHCSTLNNDGLSTPPCDELDSNGAESLLMSPLERTEAVVIQGYPLRMSEMGLKAPRNHINVMYQ
nr:3-galactosyl-N-acetylglucosaminide 4-alpha-L-fucosyltransferase FUT3-like [Procambarus clarkii]